MSNNDLIFTLQHVNALHLEGKNERKREGKRESNKEQTKERERERDIKNK
jgi:hypothetical protein